MLKISNILPLNLLILCISFVATNGEDCTDLSGLWRNQLGSNMTILHLAPNLMTGEYSTAVETERSSALLTSNITGTFIPQNKGALLAFTVLFNNGQSLTTWVGQCLVCNGEEVLFTSWSLRSRVHPVDKWKATRINQDTFKRIPGTVIPFHLRGPSIKDVRSSLCEKLLEAGINKGVWLSENKDAVEFTECRKSGEFSGLNNNKFIVGRNDGNHLFRALGFVKGSKDNIRGWTGHIHESLVEKRKIETTWLEHFFTNDCQDPRRQVRFGATNYTLTFKPFKEADAKRTTPKKSESTWMMRLIDYVTSMLPGF